MLLALLFTPHPFRSISGSESVALKVADFVVKAFNTVNKSNSPRKKQNRPSNDDYAEDSYTEESSYQDKPNAFYQTSTMLPWRHLIRLLGLRPNQISAVAVNALVFVAQMVRNHYLIFFELL